MRAAIVRFLPRMKKGPLPFLGLAFLTGLNLFNYLDRYVLAAVLPTASRPNCTSMTLRAASSTSAFMIGYFCHVADLRLPREIVRRASG